MATRFFLSRQQVSDDNGAPLPGALLNFYVTGTSTRKNTFSDAALTTANANPVVANSAGRFGDIFLSSGSYKAVLTDASGNAIWTADPFDGAVDNTTGTDLTLSGQLTLEASGLSTPGLYFSDADAGFYHHTASVDPVTGDTNTLGIVINGSQRYRFFETVLSCALPAGDNFGITDGTRVFHIGNDGVGYYINTTTNHYLRLTTTNGTGPTLTLGDASGGGTGVTGRFAFSAHPVCIGTTDFTGATNGFAFDVSTPANSVLRSTTGSGTRTHHAFYKSGGTLVGSITTDDSSTTYATTSDERLKDEVGSITDAGAIIDALDPVWFRWKVAPDDDPMPGLMAQATQAVAPYAVRAGTTGEDVSQPWMMDHSKLVPLLIAELKSLRARIAALEAA